MSARLTLLLLCDAMGSYPLLVSELVAAGFQVFEEASLPAAKRRLRHSAMDLILIRLEELQDGTLLGSELKMIAGRTPIMLLAGDDQKLAPQVEIDSICRADLEDETVTHALAFFFRGILSNPAGQRRSHALEQAAALSPIASKSYIAV